MITGKKLTGTSRYASISTHKGFEQGRCDDLECLGYSLLFLAKGELPWQGIKSATKEQKYKAILRKKQEISVEMLCKDLPIEFAQYMFYSRALKFEDKPDYKRLAKLFKNLLHSKFEEHYDWEKIDISQLIKNISNESKEKPLLNDSRIEKLLHQGLDLKKEVGKSSNRKITNKSLEAEVVSSTIEIGKLQTLPAQKHSKKESCNFNNEVIAEDPAFLKDSIPGEKIIPVHLKLPLCSFINNTRHYNKYRWNRRGLRSRPGFAQVKTAFFQRSRVTLMRRAKSRQS